jgi:hypothetical protein
VVLIPQKVANRLRQYIEDRKMDADQRILPLTYQGARAMVRKKAGDLVGIAQGFSPTFFRGLKIPLRCNLHSASQKIGKSTSWLHVFNPAVS